MPHFTIEYSANLDGDLDMVAFCEMLKKAGIETGVFEEPGIRVRALRCDAYSIADGNPANAFIDISVRLRAGRELERRKAATQHIFAAAEAYLEEMFKARPLALSFEMRDIDPELSPKRNSIREHMKRAGAKAQAG
ncbi:5-carboxymethyl-2-hydroxymuconate Delta-isomerase [Afifella sp. IM 167]|uniref:5-carboxymethyl-2-hydroxymuconate Delta-isomerase n=1 Tax=Afifella sp. IM 167 TaxID=2033586 RepID=UPI001CC9A76A|nr:5-carboxymethyl-2-hydroxymuconate Delta-isomerase [Afifella sp. IM 167]MBZ8132134.1 5-carboxymethyl-2-hydroxymuconate isomerase [Afifella sp. IM 167]